MQILDIAQKLQQLSFQGDLCHYSLLTVRPVSIIIETGRIQPNTGVTILGWAGVEMSVFIFHFTNVIK